MAMLNPYVMCSQYVCFLASHFLVFMLVRTIAKRDLRLARQHLNDSHTFYVHVMEWNSFRKLAVSDPYNTCTTNPTC